RQEGAPMQPGRQTQMGGYGLSNVRIAFPEADRASGEARPRAENGNALARVIGPLPCRVTAVISREDQKVAIAQPGQRLRQASIERLKRRGITRHIAAVAV